MARKFDRKMRTAFNNLLQEKPLDQITVSELTDNVGITRPAFYYHYSSIKECILVNIDNEMRRIEKNYEGPDDMLAMMTEVMGVFKENLLFSQKINESENRGLYLARIRERFEDRLTAVITEYIRENDLTVSRTNKKHLVMYLADGFSGILDMYLRSNMYNEPKTLINKYTMFLGRSVSDIIREFSEGAQPEEEK